MCVAPFLPLRSISDEVVEVVPPTRSTRTDDKLSVMEILIFRSCTSVMKADAVMVEGHEEAKGGWGKVGLIEDSVVDKARLSFVPLAKLKINLDVFSGSAYLMFPRMRMC